MKRIMALLLCFMLLASSAACSEKTAPNKNKATELTQEESTDAVTEPTENESTDAVTEPTENENTDVVTEPTEGESDGDRSFTEVVAVDNAECMIKITGIDPDNLWGYTLNVQLENKSTEKTYMFTVDNAAINGVQCGQLFATEVAAGKKANKEIVLFADELEENDIGEYTDIELTFRVYDTNDWSADDVANETVHVYPFGKDQTVQFVREAKETDLIIADNEFVKAIVTGYEYDEIWGYTLNLFLVNKTDKNVMFTVDETSVNGYMVDPFYAESVAPGKCTFSSMDWSDTDFEENEITDVEEIEFVFRAYNMDDWMEDDYVNEAITLNP